MCLKFGMAVMYACLTVYIFYTGHASGQAFTDCGGDIVARSGNKGFVTSPNFAEKLLKYPINANCTWTITCPADENVIMKFDFISVTPLGYKCPNEGVFLEIGARFPQRFCSDQPCFGLEQKNVNDIVSKGNVATINFITDSDNSASSEYGFKLAYTCGDYCGGELAASPDRNETLSSPGFASGLKQYPAELNCTWTIRCKKPKQKVVLDFDFFATEKSPEYHCDYDYVTINNGENIGQGDLGQFCGDNFCYAENAKLPTDTIMSNGSVVTVNFISDQHTSNYGFQLHYTCTDGGAGGGAGEEDDESSESSASESSKSSKSSESEGESSESSASESSKSSKSEGEEDDESSESSKSSESDD